jgi:hypothetical protein
VTLFVCFYEYNSFFTLVQASGENKEDEKIFAHLKNVELELDPVSKRNYSIVLTFSDNEWFTNSTLKKTFIYDPADELGQEPI